MWKRNLLFVLAVSGGVTAVLAGLLMPPPPAELARQVRHQPLLDARDTLRIVNEQFARSWQEHRLEVAPAAAPETVIRRLSLALTGTTPSLEELRMLDRIAAEDRISWWVDYLLADRRSADYLAERWARALVGTDQGPFILFRRRRFVSWLADQLAANRPYDEIARALIGDEGIWTDTPAVNFLTATVSDDTEGRPDPVRLAGRTARVFLGMRIDCLQCHDDPLSMVEVGSPAAPREGLQSDFHRLAAFYADAKMSLLGLTDGYRAYKTKYLGADVEETVAEGVPFQEAFLPTDGRRRQRLARWITDPRNRAFARATVNRVWALMFGRALVEPVDDMPLYDRRPPGLDALADDFVRHHYDLQRLIRLISETQVFRIDSRSTEFAITAEHERYWAAYPLIRLRPEQVAGALIQACSLKTINARSHIFSQLLQSLQQNQFVRRYGDMGEDEFEDRGGTVTQRLLLMNGNLLKERTKENILLNAATRIGMLAPDDATAVEIAYLSILTRRPAPSERTRFTDRLRQTKGSLRSQAMEDLYWVLLNSSEFSWNH